MLGRINGARKSNPSRIVVQCRGLAGRTGKASASARTRVDLAGFLLFDTRPRRLNTARILPSVCAPKATCCERENPPARARVLRRNAVELLVFSIAVEEKTFHFS